jgi:tRNA (pseudouridine54-N1)-methyltransferase
MVREFILFSRLGRTDSNFGNLHDAGRLDIAYECIVAGLFLSHGIRKNAAVHVVLNGPPKPPLHVEIKGESLFDVRTDLDTWQNVLKKVLAGRQHPGITIEKNSFESLLRTKAENSRVYILEEGGEDIVHTDIEANSVFVLGDHVGLPKKAEVYALRYGEKISLGRQPYLAASCITILNYLMDRQIKSGF